MHAAATPTLARATAAALTMLALLGAVSVGGDPFGDGDCITVGVDSPNTGQHPSVDVCRPA